MVNNPWLLLVSALCFVVVASLLRYWYVAERDERRWRRRLEEQRQAALVREYRYGSSKRGDL